MVSVREKLRAMKETMIKRIVYGSLLLLVSIVSFFIFGDHGVIAWCVSSGILIVALLLFYMAFVSWKEIRRVKAALLRNATMSNAYDKN